MAYAVSHPADARDRALGGAQTRSPSFSAQLIRHFRDTYRAASAHSLAHDGEAGDAREHGAGGARSLEAQLDQRRHVLVQLHERRIRQRGEPLQVQMRQRRHLVLATRVERGDALVA